MASSMSSVNPTYRNLQEKADEINLELLQPDVDLWKLRELALSEGGLVNGMSYYVSIVDASRP
jgi:hypothetical protein